jgi:Flp pilus assembly protein TadD
MRLKSSLHRTRPVKARALGKRLPLGLALAGLTLAGCASAPNPQEQAMLAMVRAPDILPADRAVRDQVAREDPITQAAFWNNEYQKNPADLEAARASSEALRRMGSTQRAIEVASQALALHSNDVELGLTLSKALISDGNGLQAIAILEQIAALAPSDWRVPATLGLAYDQTGRHGPAQRAYMQAMGQRPGEVSVVSNLGLSFLIAGDPVQAEHWLRRAAALPGADARVRQNLSLALSLQGKFEEAEKVALQDLTADMARSNVGYVRAMLAPQRRWDTLRGPVQD